MCDSLKKDFQLVETEGDLQNSIQNFAEQIKGDLNIELGDLKEMNDDVTELKGENDM